MGGSERRPWGLTIAIVAIVAAVAAGSLCAGPALARAPVPLPRPRPAIRTAAIVPRPVPAQAVPLPLRRPPIAAASREGERVAEAPVSLAPPRSTAVPGHTLATPLLRPTSGIWAVAQSRETPASDVATLRHLIEAIRAGRTGEADAAERNLSDPVARKLAEWIILRSDSTDATFPRYAAFIDANPTWPHVTLFRRRAENALWNDNADNATVRGFFATHPPTTAKGRYVLARALLAEGDRAGAAALVRYAWRNEDCSAEVERRVLEMFGDMITPDDNKSRMEHRFYANDAEAGLRAAERLGGVELAIARARAAVLKRAHNAKALLDAVPVSARSEPGYMFARIQWLRHENKPEDASRLILAASRDPAALVDTNQWWIERRILIRKLLDDHDAQTAYRLARDAAPPTQGNYRVDQHFTAGWIALRFLHDPRTALVHFARIMDGTHNPHALSRGGYWLGRAYDALGERAQARAWYEKAAQYCATYYGQLARARAGLPDLGLHGPPVFTARERELLGNLEVVRAAELLFRLDQPDMIASMYAELGESAHDVAGMAMLGDLAARHNDGRAMVLLGSGAYGRGLPLEYYAYPLVGLPPYRPIAPPIEEAVAYSIARQESHFNQKVVSSAHAMGLMQVTPEAAQDTARKFRAPYNRARLLSDAAYNMQMGAAELSNLLSGYNGSYILTFAGYNAGRGRVRQWIAAFGDPRDPGVDPVDWVERIPISETRNYVERVMENLQVYRARFNGNNRLVIEADLRRGKSN